MKKIISLINQNKILTSILIIAALLRFVGTNPGYNQYHADEGITYSAAVSMIKNNNLDPLRYDYPALVPDINYIFFRVIFIPLNWAKYYLTHIPDIIDGIVHIPIAPLEEKTLFQTYVLGERNIHALHWGRYVTAFFSLLDVLLVYLLSRRLFNSKALGLLTAFLLTFNYKHVINSHIGLPDVYNAFFVLLTLLLVVNLWKKPSLKNYLLAGIAVGLSFSVKYQIFAVFPLILVHLYISFEKKLNLRKLFNPAIFLSMIFIPLTFALISPYFFVHFDKAIEIVKGVSQKYGMGAKQLNLYPFSYFYNIDYGPIEFVLVLIGLFIALKKFRKETLLLLSFLIPFMFILIYYSRGGFYVRNFITSTPLLMIFAAIALWQLYKLIARYANSKLALVVILIFLPIVVFIPAKSAIINSYYYSKPWGYDLMRPWVQENLPKDITVATHPFDAVNLKITNSRTEFENAGAFSLPEHLENGASYLVLDLNWVGYPFYFWMNYGPGDLKLYWGKPLDHMRNMFHGLATEQFFRYQVHAVTKPWQAPDTHILIIKFPDFPETEMKKLKSFNFDQGFEGWELRGRINPGDNPYKFDESFGKDEKGSLVFYPEGAKLPIIRMTSPAVPVKVGHLYNIEGFLKTEKKLETREREGFLRVDFYGENPNLEKVGMISAVSARVWGSSEFVKKEILERAPEGAKYLTVSFQTHITTKTKIWLDDVSIKESKEVVDDLSANPPYNIFPMDLNYVYPNSHGNL